MPLSIIMYHYVRPEGKGRYPGLRVLDTENFRRQLDYLQEHYSPVRAEDVADALEGRRELPRNACLLTFDDGYLDHYVTVFPELVKRGLQGCFYPAVSAIMGDSLLDVNKLQLLLAHYDYGDVTPLIRRMEQIYVAMRKEAGDALPQSFASLRGLSSNAARHDSSDIRFVKALLQYELSPKWRSRILDALFKEIIGEDEETLAREFYMTRDMLAVMAGNGMHVGSHGASHSWLNYLPPESQAVEIAQSLEMLAEIYGRNNFFWSMCYPFGGNNEHTRRICAKNGCAFGLDARPGLASMVPDERFALPRIDTVNMPFQH